MVKYVGEHGVEYEVVLTPFPLVEDGFCTHPQGPLPRIVVKSGLPHLDLVETLIHEMIHGGAWNLDEEIVHHMAAEITRVLNELSLL